VLPSPMATEGFRHGDLGEVKSAAEVLATLDELGRLEGLPFMPEMLSYCGTRHVVDKRAEKICDTIYPIASNRLPDTVLLGNLRCDGSGHNGCQADCRLYWKENWLRPVHPGESPASAQAGPERDRLADVLARNTRPRDRAQAATETYRCQATQLSAAGQRLGLLDPQAYLRVYTTGNVSLGRFLKVMARAMIEEPMRKFGITPRVFVSGTATNPPRDAPLNLQPGDLVQVKSKEEIIATLGPDGKNRGLFFDREMLPYCGGTFRVKKRVTRFIDDRSGGKMIKLRSDCVTLEGVICSGELSPVRWFCPREIHSFWREAWLRRVPEATVVAQQSRTDLASLEHHPGWNQVDTDEAQEQ
jgi:hypothetical protein